MHKRYRLVSMPALAAEAAILWGVWLLLVGKVQWAESAVGAAAALVAAVAAETLRIQRLAGFKPDFRWLLLAWRVPGYFVTGTISIFVELFRKVVLRREPDSRFAVIPFDAGGSDSRSAARRALTVMYTTSAPNFIVVSIDREEDSMLIHQVQAGSVPGVTKKLGAR